MPAQYHHPRVRSHTPRHRLALNSQPRLQSFFRPTIGMPMRSANIAPPRQYQPPTTISQVIREEPTISIRTLSNGVQSVQPLRQILGGTSARRPVFVITRQMKTPSGEVYHQRITHPVQPPTKYVHVVHRVSPEATGTIQPPSQQVAVMTSSATSRRVVQLPTPTLLSPTTTQPTLATANTTITSTLPPRKIIRVIRSTAPNAIRILPPRAPP